MKTSQRDRRRSAALLLCGALATPALTGCWSGSSVADPGPTHTGPVPATSGPTTQDTAALRAADIASAKTSYTAWVAMQPTKKGDLPARAHEIATQAVIDKTNKVTGLLFQNGTTSTGYTKVAAMKVVEAQRYPHWSVALEACLASTERFMRDGKDVTVDPHGKPLPKGERRTQVLVTFALAQDGKTWKVDTTQPQDKPC